MKATIYDVYDRQNRFVFSGTVWQIADHFSLSFHTVRNCYERGGRLLWEYRIENSGRKETDMKYIHSVYKVYDESGKVDFRGSVPEIADHYFVSRQNVYAIAEGKFKHLLGKYTLEYDGEEAMVR